MFSRLPSHQCTWGCKTGAKSWKDMVDTTLAFLCMQRSLNKSQEGTLQHLDQQWDNLSNSFWFILIPMQHHLVGNKQYQWEKNMSWRCLHVYLWWVVKHRAVYNFNQFHGVWLAISISSSVLHKPPKTPSWCSSFKVARPWNGCKSCQTLQWTKLKHATGDVLRSFSRKNR